MFRAPPPPPPPPPPPRQRRRRPSAPATHAGHPHTSPHASEISAGLPSPRQQRRLSHVDHARQVHRQAVGLFHQGRNGEAITLNNEARRLAGLKPFTAEQQRQLAAIASSPIVRKGERIIAQQQDRQQRQFDARTRDWQRKHPTAHLGFSLGGGLHGVGLIASDLKTAGLNAPAGIAATAKGGAEDVGAAARGDLSFKHSRAIAKAMLVQTAADLRHPMRHPGFTALDALAVASAGAGTASRVAGAGRALSAGEGFGRALTRPGYEGGSLLHKRAPGETELAPGVHRLEPDNPLLRPAHRLRTKALRRKLAHPDRQEATTALGKGLQATIGPENVVGRELRAAGRVQADLAKAPGVSLERVARGQSLPQRTALRLIAIEGNHALRDPVEVVTRQAASHRAWAAEGIHPEVNEQVARDIEAALPILKARNKEFLRHVRAARRLSHQAERQAVDRGQITRDQAEQRKFEIANQYGSPAKVGGKYFGSGPPGSFYFPSGERFKLMGKTSPPARAYSPRPSPYGVGEPSEGHYMGGTLKRFTGRGLRHGVVEKPAQAIAQRHTGQQRLYSAQDLVEHARQLGSDTRTSELQIAVRDKRSISPELRQQIDAQLERAAGGDENALARAHRLLEEGLRDERLTNETPVGAHVRGVTWIDKRMLKQATADPQGRLLSLAAKVNKPFRFLGVYLRPAYIATNLPQNVGMQALVQGLGKATANLVRARRARQSFGNELTDMIESGMGTARSQSYRPRGKLGTAEEKVTGWVTHLTDRDVRVSAFLYRAAERGYKPNKAELRRLLTDPKNEQDRIAVFRRARKDAVDFDSLTPPEKELTDVVFFYPWISRSTAWAARTAANRPIKTAGLVQAGRTRQAQQLLEQNVPDWARGYLRIGGKVVNPNPVGPFSTQGELARDIPDALKGLAGRKTFGADSSLATEFGTPAVQGFAGVNPLGSLAPLAAWKRSGLPYPRALLGKRSKSFPRTGFGPAVGPIVAGGLYPRTPADKYLAEQEQKTASPEQKLDRLRASQDRHIANLLRKGVLPPKYKHELRHALDLYNERQALYAKVEREIPSDHPQTRAKHKLLGLVDILERGGVLKPENAVKWRDWARKGGRTASDLNEGKDYLWRDNKTGKAVRWFRIKAGATD